MAQQDLAGLLTGITQAPIDPMAGQSMAQRQLAFGAQAAQGLRQGMGGLFGADTRTTKEKADQMLASLDVTKKDDRDQMLQIVSNVNPQAVPALRARFTQMDAQTLATQEAKTKAEAAAQKADIVNLGGGFLYKVSTGEFLTAPGVAEAKADKDAPKPLPEPAQRSLLAQADRLGVTPEARVNLVTALSTGLVTDIKGIDNFVQAPVEPNYTKEVSVAIADANKAFTEGSQGARQAEGIITNILSSDALQSAGGLRATLSEGFKEITGGRDLLSTLRTQSTAVINTEVVNNLPPGVASDRDIAIFSKGFPNPDTATFQELQEYLEASKRINQSLADYGQFKNQYINKNMQTTGYARLEGFIPQQRKFNAAKDFLDSQLSAENITQEAASKLLNDFEEAFGMIPQEYM